MLYNKILMTLATLLVELCFLQKMDNVNLSEPLEQKMVGKYSSLARI